MLKGKRLPTNDMVIKHKQNIHTRFKHYYTGCRLQQFLSWKNKYICMC